MKFLKTIAPAALSELWEKVSGNIVAKDTSAAVGIGGGQPADYSYANDLVINSVNANNYGGITVKGADGTDVNGIRFAIATGSGTNTYKGFVQYSHVNNSMELGTSSTGRVSIDSAGDVEIDTGNLVIGTAGKGIDFSNQASPAAGMTSELLDRYEEGTWTPVIEGSSGDGSFTYSTQVGFYTRIGNTMWISFYVFVNSSNVSSYPTGTIEISGLPFSVTISTASGFQSVPTGYNNPGSGTTTYGGRWQANAATKFDQYSSASSFSGSTHMEFSGAGVLAVA